MGIFNVIVLELFPPIIHKIQPMINQGSRSTIDFPWLELIQISFGSSCNFKFWLINYHVNEASYMYIFVPIHQRKINASLKQFSVWFFMVSKLKHASLETMSFSSSNPKEKLKLNIQSFHQCSSLILVKLSTTNFLLWRSHVLPLVCNLGGPYHLTSSFSISHDLLTIN